MTEFGQILGTLMSSLAHARRIADEETAIIAEYYKDNPLLQGMSVPRVRVPELKLDLPILFKIVEEGSAPTLEEDTTIIHNIMDTLESSLTASEVNLEKKLLTVVEKYLQDDLRKFRVTIHPGSRIQREHIARIADTAFLRAVKDFKLSQFTASNIGKISSDLRKAAREIAFKKDPEPAKIDASIITSEVKEHAAAGNVVRLQLVMKEEGLEWDVIRNSDGTTTSQLSPE